jgi:WD40 repeat protein
MIAKMRYHSVRIPLLLLEVLIVSGCGAESRVHSSPNASPGRADGPGAATAAPKVVKPSGELSKAAAAGSRSDAPEIAKASSATEHSVATGGHQDKRPEAARGAPPAESPAPKALVKPSVEQIARWRIPEFPPLVLLACRDGFGEAALLDLAISSSGKQFVVAGSKLTLWNTTDSQPTASLLANYKTSDVERPLPAVAISDDDKWLAAGDQKGRVRIWSLGNQREALLLAAHPGRVARLAFSPNSQLLATTSYAGDVALWELPEGKPLKSLKISDRELTHLSFLSDKVLAAASTEVSLWEVASGKKATALTNEKVRTPGFALSPDRRILAFDESDSTVQLWDVRNARPTGVTVRGAGVALAAFSHDGKWLAAYLADLTICIWDTATGSLVQTIDADGDRTTALEWFPGANVLLVGSLDGRVRMWGTTDAARSLGVEPMRLPELPALAAGAHRSLSSGQFARIIDVRSLPRLPGAIGQFGGPGMCSYMAPASQEDAMAFYRYLLDRKGWSESPVAMGPGWLTFRKDGCELSVAFSPADTGGDKNVQISLQLAGSYDARWLPKVSPIDSKSGWGFFSTVGYRTKASLVDVEVELLKLFHEAGWTGYTLLAASGNEDPNARHISLLQGGTNLTVFVSRPADAPGELAVQTSVSVSNKSLPIPPDAGWIEYDESTNVQLVINTKMDLPHTTEFYDKAMAAEGWLARDAGRQIKDGKGFLPYIRGQQDVLVRLVARPGGGTRVIVGEAARFSWQFREPNDSKKPKTTDGPGIEAADLTLPAGATGVKFDVDEKHIQFEMAGTTPTKLAAQLATKIEAFGWMRTRSGVTSEEYVLMSFKKGKAEVQFRTSAVTKTTSAIISGDGILWNKPLPVAAVPISYETWLRRNRKDASLDLLDEFATEMHKLPSLNPPK